MKNMKEPVWQWKRPCSLLLVDNYFWLYSSQMNPRSIKNPPDSFFKKLRFLGPGFILSASIVGSGELVATTVLGAKAGFITFWVILVSCLIKVAIQLEFGKNAIVSGRSLMQEFDQFPGPSIGKANWAVWSTFILTSLKILQIGGMMGGS